VRYDHDGGAKALAAHSDDSAVTLSLCLRDDFGGGELAVGGVDDGVATLEDAATMVEQRKGGVGEGGG
jgi:hypothetical protein